jgi:hypothetical protein
VSVNGCATTAKILCKDLFARRRRREDRRTARMLAGTIVEKD